MLSFQQLKEIYGAHCFSPTSHHYECFFQNCPSPPFPHKELFIAHIEMHHQRGDKTDTQILRNKLIQFQTQTSAPQSLPRSTSTFPPQIRNGNKKKEKEIERKKTTKTKIEKNKSNTQKRKRKEEEHWENVVPITRFWISFFLSQGFCLGVWRL